MRDVKSKAMVKDLFGILADNEYSLMWSLIEDFTFNGHVVSVKSSCQFKHVVIDGHVVSINPNHSIQCGTKKFESGIDYAMHVLEA